MSNDLKSNIPSHEAKLVDGSIVVFYDYITTGESRELQKVLLEKGKFNSATGQIEDLPLSVFLDSQDKAAFFVIKEIKVGDVEMVSNQVNALSHKDARLQPADLNPLDAALLEDIYNKIQVNYNFIAH